MPVLSSPPHSQQCVLDACSEHSSFNLLTQRGKASPDLGSHGVRERERGFRNQPPQKLAHMREDRRGHGRLSSSQVFSFLSAILPGGSLTFQRLCPLARSYAQVCPFWGINKESNNGEAFGIQQKASGFPVLESKPHSPDPCIFRLFSLQLGFLPRNRPL